MTAVKTSDGVVHHFARNHQKTAFARDVIEGLRAQAKYLHSKYFYDAEGDRLFQDIMRCEEYYPFDCELEIFRERTGELVEVITRGGESFDLIELGAGDCAKSGHLLKQLLNNGIDFNYMPIDISAHIIDYLQRELPVEIPGLKVTGLNGEYEEMLIKASTLSHRRKVILFLGSNLGNMLPCQAQTFMRKIRNSLKSGDMMVIGLDLKKDPRAILAAYNDKDGITRRFNLNLLKRINRELRATFDISKFSHYPTYDPATGACKSYLVSEADQAITITIPTGVEKIFFKKGETIYMEVSQKYTTNEIDRLAEDTGFKVIEQLSDSKRWFVDTFWEAV